MPTFLHLWIQPWAALPCRGCLLKKLACEWTCAGQSSVSFKGKLYFLPSCDLSFEFSLIVSFKKQEFLILIKSQIQMFPFMGSAFDVVCENT